MVSCWGLAIADFIHSTGRPETKNRIKLGKDPELTKRAWSGANSSSKAIPARVRSWRGPYTGVEAAGTICISFGGKEPEGPDTRHAIVEQNSLSLF